MSQFRKEADLYKDLPPKKLKKVIRSYKFLSFANSDIYNFVFSLVTLLLPYLFFFKVTTFSLFVVILFHYVFYWEYLHKYKKFKIVSDRDKYEIDRVVEILEEYLEEKENKKPLS